MKLKRTERGWVGHFICGDRCRFRRNTLIEFGRKKIVISTVGNLFIDGKLEKIGADRYAETMAFKAKKDGIYWEADATKPVYFDSQWESSITDDDNKLNEMHESVVSELLLKIMRGTLSKGEAD
jgi:hypothetical protein